MAVSVRSRDAELIDRPERVTRAELAGNLADIARLNRLGTIRAILAEIAPFLDHEDARVPIRILDLGTGGADIPVAVIRWALARGRRVSVLGVDLQPEVLACAVPTASGLREIRFVQADALRLPVRPGGVDVALCSLLLHHLPESRVVQLFRALAEVSRLGFIVSDLRRSRLGHAAAWLATRAISRNRLTRHDGPLSVRRAYTPAELRRLSADAGLAGIRWWRTAPFRVLGVYRRAS